jgi:hypothetical protein
MDSLLKDSKIYLMSKLLAINPEVIEDRKELQYLFSHIGQQKSYFLADIPSNIENKLKDKITSLNISSDIQYKLINQLAIFKQRREIYSSKLNTSQSNFNDAIKEIHSKDKRLNLAISDVNEKPLKTFDGLDPDDFPGPDSFRYSNQNKNELANSFWNYIEFSARSAAKISLVGRNNILFNSAREKTNLSYILEKIFMELSSWSRCEEFLIYCSTKSIDVNKVKEQEKLIKALFSKLSSYHKPKYGIRYIVLDEIIEERNTDLHQRFFLTNYSAVTMGDELGNRTSSIFQVITDGNLISSLHEYWLEHKHGLKVAYEIS